MSHKVAVQKIDWDGLNDELESIGKPKPSGSKAKKYYAIGSAFIAVMFIGVSLGVMNTATTPTGFPTVIEPGSMVGDYTYIIFENGGYYYAKNGATGGIDLKSTNLSEVINNAVSSMVQGRILLRGAGENWSLNHMVNITHKDIGLYCEPRISISAPWTGYAMFVLNDVNTSDFYFYELDGMKTVCNGSIGLIVFNSHNLNIKLRSVNMSQNDVYFEGDGAPNQKNQNIFLQIDSENSGNTPVCSAIYLDEYNEAIHISGSIEGSYAQAIYCNHADITIGDLLVSDCAQDGRRSLDFRSRSIVQITNVKVDYPITSLDACGLFVEVGAVVFAENLWVNHSHQYGIWIAGYFFGTNIRISNGSASMVQVFGGSDHVEMSNFLIDNFPNDPFYPYAGIGIQSTSQGGHKFTNGKIIGLGYGIYDNCNYPSTYTNLNLTGALAGAVSPWWTVHTFVNCEGFVAVSHGNVTITGAFSTLTVDHRLSATPATIIVTVNNTGCGDYAVTSITTTQFVITFTVQPGTNEWKFYWYAEV